MENLCDISEELLAELYKTMLRIRMVEEKISKHYCENEMKTPIHLCIGQEAISVGICENLRVDDYVFSNHRGHGHYLAKKGDLNSMIAELYNRETGCSRGRGGSMHLIDTDVGLLGSSSIVAGGIPLATGAALASKIRKDGRISVAFFGDGAAEEGALYESINFAVLKSLPIIYVCENNLYSVCSPLINRQPKGEIFERMKGLGLLSIKVDGNDAIEVYDRSKGIVDYVRKGIGPAFVECLTYRLMDHHGVKTGVDVGYQSQEEWNIWEAKCPIKKIEKLLLENGCMTEERKDEIRNAIEKDIESAFAYAKASPLPNRTELSKNVYM